MNGSFNERRLRTRKWLARQGPGAQMLELYLRLLELQEPLYEEARESDWGERVRRPSGEVPALDLARLPVAALVPGFERFLRDLIPVATEVLADLARGQVSAGDGARLLETFLHRQDLEEAAASLACDPVQLEFFPRAFLQPAAEAMAEHHVPGGPGDRSMRSCPQCGWPPQVGVLRDEPEIKGRRLLVCSLCATWWSFPRSTCPGCGESDPEKLLYHVSESMPAIRVEECRTCRGYLKAVDLRRDGTAVPLVEDLASVELDVWSDERGLWKFRRNLLGI